ncbi:MULTISPECIES: OmpA family protein [Janthinobacterium]|uniref:OmpA family protein n=1 Tax=Janthinobacterium TaxID=29580 RepID=UPI001C5A5B1E|nr:MULTISPECIES: OmpA family protein [Janthinobacterium]MBW3511729.1 OmpA family protein [Janthinobacterium sp. NKUCC06_STL]MCA1863669.1 OmpA family protein [Janthinobacterium lividum]
MTIAHTLGALSVMTGALLAAQSAQAQDNTFINPDWANSAWYIGAGVGQSRANIDEPRLRASLAANGETVTGFTKDQRDTGYKLFVGRQLNQYFAVEAGYFDLGKFDFKSSTSGNGVLNGQAGFRGVNLDLLGQLPLSQRLSLLGRVGMHYTKTNTEFSGNRLLGSTNTHASERKLNAKLGLGLEYKFSEALALRGEVERYRLNDAVGNRGDADLYSVSLVYKLGRPASATPAYQPAPEVAPVVAMPAPVIVAAPAPAPVSEKVSFASEALFDFDQSTLKPQGKAALDQLLGQLSGMDLEVIVTVGHTDAVGPDAYNQKLSQRRAEAVKAYLVAQGVETNRVYTEGKGETQPVADNTSAAGRAKNRRVTVEVVGTKKVAR